jgi:hypothetical protein
MIVTKLEVRQCQKSLHGMLFKKILNWILQKKKKKKKKKVFVSQHHFVKATEIDRSNK